MRTESEISYPTVKILLVEDNQAHADLAIEALKAAKVRVLLSVVETGEEALEYLHKENDFSNATKPDLILLDLNLPGIDGREVLEVIKTDPSLKCIPVIILTTSDAEKDMLRTYNAHANCYIKKPVDFDQFQQAIHKMTDFWFTLVKIPQTKCDALSDV
ncbi:MAG: response regulator [Gammaproteobacteria bacterium]|nr:MAG: response regulator [Gammaproteobacteria bacterium]